MNRRRTTGLCSVRARVVQVFVALLVLLFTTEASAGYKFCNRWVYVFWDSNLGEDYLRENGTTGNIDASWAWAAVSRNGSLVYSGYADAVGCTAQTFTVSGNYTVRWYPAISRAPGQAFFVYLNANEIWSYYNYDYGYVMPAGPESSTWSQTVGEVGTRSLQ